MTVPTAPLPYVDVEATPDSRRFWEELAEGRVTIPWCATCDTWVWHPRPLCSRCLTKPEIERTLSGEGEVYSFSIVHRPAEGFAAVGPYVVAYVALDGGPTVISNVVGAGCLEVSIGDRVRFSPDSTVVLGALRFVRLPT